MGMSTMANSKTGEEMAWPFKSSRAINITMAIMRRHVSWRRLLFLEQQRTLLGYLRSRNKKETWCGKNKYIGEIKDNKRHGIGTYIYSNGSMYEG